MLHLARSAAAGAFILAQCPVSVEGFKEALLEYTADVGIPMDQHMTTSVNTTKARTTGQGALCIYRSIYGACLDVDAVCLDEATYKSCFAWVMQSDVNLMKNHVWEAGRAAGILGDGEDFVGDLKKQKQGKNTTDFLNRHGPLPATSKECKKMRTNLTLWLARRGAVVSVTEHGRSSGFKDPAAWYRKLTTPQQLRIWSCQGLFLLRNYSRLAAAALGSYKPAVQGCWEKPRSLPAARYGGLRSADGERWATEKDQAGAASGSGGAPAKAKRSRD